MINKKLRKEVCAAPMLMISQIGGVYMYLSHVNDITDVNDMTNLMWIPVSNQRYLCLELYTCPMLIISEIGDVDMPYV